MRIDSHLHFWDVTRFQYTWMPPDSPLRQNCLPDLIAPILKRNRIDAAVLIQALPDVAETGWLLEIAARTEVVSGVVGWANVTDTGLGDSLDGYQRHPKFRGLRHPVQNEPDPEWLLRPDVIAGLTEAARRGLTFDLLIRPAHLGLLPALAERVPGIRLVIDHLAKPPIAGGVLEPWATDLARAARIPNVYCKVSGMITEMQWSVRTAGQLRPYVAHALEVFGPDRLMFGSDWPVCWLGGKWKDALAAFTQAIGPQTMETREKLLGETAARFYGL